MKTTWMLFAALLLAAPLARSAEPELGIVTVDLQRALNESTAGKRAKEVFKTEVDRLQADLAKQRDGLEALKQDLEKKGLVLKEDERRQVERDYQKRLRDFQRTYQDSQNELQARDKELTAEILRELTEIIADYGSRSNYTLILEASNTGTVLYNARTIDITEEIIKAYDAWKRKQ